METSTLAVALQVAAGGALGSVSRYLTRAGFERLFASNFPYATLAVNVGGSFAVGVLFVLLGGFSGESNRWAPLFLTGFLGGYTTFSAFSLDAWQLFHQGRVYESVLYVAGTVSLSLVAALAGIAATRYFQS